MYRYFKRQLKTPTCFGSFGIHPQRVLKRASLKLFEMFCVCSRCLAAWNLDLWCVCVCVCLVRRVENYSSQQNLEKILPQYQRVCHNSHITTLWLKSGLHSKNTSTWAVVLRRVSGK